MGYLLCSTKLFLSPLHQCHQLKLLLMLIWIVPCYWKLFAWEYLVLNLRLERWLSQLCSWIRSIIPVLY